MSDHFLSNTPAARASDATAYTDGASPTAHVYTDGAGPAGGACPAGISSDGAQPPADVSLLLRAHAERRWLSREVIPVVRQIETAEGLPDEQLPAALAYLEVIWTAALDRAAETDAEHRRLDARDPAAQPLLARARRYHAVVRDLREAVARRVAGLLQRNVAARL